MRLSTRPRGWRYAKGEYDHALHELAEAAPLRETSVPNLDAIGSFNDDGL